MTTPLKPPTTGESTRISGLWVIVVAGGSGRRYGSLKQFESIGDEGERVIDRSVAVAASVADGVVAVVPAELVPDETDTLARVVATTRSDLHVVGGGDTRADSVRAGLAVIPESAAVVCVHDGARPAASPSLYRRVVGAVNDGADGAVPGVAVVDTIKLVGDDGVVIDTPPRDRLVAVQTPQAFDAHTLRRAHAANADGSDDAVLVEEVGGRVVVVPGEHTNIKITQPADLDTIRPALATSA